MTSTNIFKTAAFVLLLAGCFSSISSCIGERNTTLGYENGLVRDFGSPAVDGCGWVIIVGDSIYAPIRLDDKFCKDSLKIYVDYKNLSTFRNCNWWEPGKRVYPEIEILTIKMR